jgi:hypothetical protein
MTALRSLAVVAVLAGPAAHLADDPVPADTPYPLQLKVGGTLSLCATGTITCPAKAVRCDDPKVVAPAEGPDGAAVRGVAPGTTICSAAGGTVLGTRRVYRVTVVPDDARSR